MMLSKEMMWVLYAVIIIVLGFVGWYVGEKYEQKEIGAGVGVVAGAILAGILYNYMPPEESETQTTMRR